MTPVLFGRIQTRLFVLFTVGALWTLLISPFLLVNAPGQDGYKIAFTIDNMVGDSGLVATYKLAFAALVITAIFGCLVWEPLYHFLMQFRWEKDWPALFHLLSMIPEGISTFLLLHIGILNPLQTESGAPFVPVAAYAFLFFTTWIVTWLVANGPMKIFFVRWRFSGGRLV
jgi:hypothetical protein